MSSAVVITGGGRGIGAATARLAAERGFSVCVNYRKNRNAAERVVNAIESNGGRATMVAADVSVDRRDGCRPRASDLVDQGRGLVPLRA